MFINDRYQFTRAICATTGRATQCRILCAFRRAMCLDTASVTYWPLLPNCDRLSVHLDPAPTLQHNRSHANRSRVCLHNRLLHRDTAPHRIGRPIGQLIAPVKPNIADDNASRLFVDSGLFVLHSDKI